MVVPVNAPAKVKQGCLHTQVSLEVQVKWPNSSSVVLLSFVKCLFSVWWFGPVSSSNTGKVMSSPAVSQSDGMLSVFGTVNIDPHCLWKT